MPSPSHAPRSLQAEIRAIFDGVVTDDDWRKIIRSLQGPPSPPNPQGKRALRLIEKYAYLIADYISTEQTESDPAQITAHSNTAK